jgi:hypothetical protein
MRETRQTPPTDYRENRMVQQKSSRKYSTKHKVTPRHIIQASTLENFTRIHLAIGDGKHFDSEPLDILILDIQETMENGEGRLGFLENAVDAMDRR